MKKRKVNPKPWRSAFSVLQFNFEELRKEVMALRTSISFTRDLVDKRILGMARVEIPEPILMRGKLRRTSKLKISTGSKKAGRK